MRYTHTQVKRQSSVAAYYLQDSLEFFHHQ